MTHMELLNFDENAPLDSGTCGQNIRWTLDADGCLTLTGSGELTAEHYARITVPLPGWETETLILAPWVINSTVRTAGTVWGDPAACLQKVSRLVIEGNIFGVNRFFGDMDTGSLCSVEDVRPGLVIAPAGSDAEDYALSRSIPFRASAVDAAHSGPSPYDWDPALTPKDIVSLRICRPPAEINFDGRALEFHNSFFYIHAQMPDGYFSPVVVELTGRPRMKLRRYLENMHFDQWQTDQETIRRLGSPDAAPAGQFSCTFEDDSEFRYEAESATRKDFDELYTFLRGFFAQSDKFHRIMAMENDRLQAVGLKKPGLKNLLGKYFG